MSIAGNTEYHRNSNHISILSFLVELDVCCYFDHMLCQVMFEMIFARITLHFNISINSAYLNCDEQGRIASQYSIVAMYLSPRSYPSASCQMLRHPTIAMLSPTHHFCSHNNTMHTRTLRQC